MISLTMPTKQQHQTGFTLVEMAIVLAIVALLLGGLLPVISSQIEQQRRNETRKQLNEIKDALIGFTIINGRLPCPAVATTPTIPGVANGAGQEQAPCVAGSNGGVLPWVTLGISETDAWGRRFTYRVTLDFADANGTTSGCATPAPPQASFALCSSGNLNVGLTAGSSDVAANVPAVIVSHGANGLGAYTQAGQQVPPIPAAATDEGDNTDNDNTFVSRDQIQNSFDDLVIWLSPNTLANRLVAAGKLP